MFTCWEPTSGAPHPCPNVLTLRGHYLHMESDECQGHAGSLHQILNTTMNLMDGITFTCKVFASNSQEVNFLLAGILF